MDIPFDLNALNMFLTVCDHGGMAAAARVLGITQPAVSQAVGDIEERSGVLLFDRSVRPIALTPSGTELRRHGMTLMEEARQIVARIREIQSGRVLQLRVGIVDSVCLAVSNPISVFMAARVERLVVHSGLTESHGAALFSRQLDLVIGVDDFDDAVGLERWPLLEEPYLLLMPSGIMPPEDAAGLSALAREIPFTRFSSRSRTGAEVDRYLRRIGADIPRSQEFDTPSGVHASCRRGGMAITTPLCLFESGLAGLQGLVCAELPGRHMRRSLTLVSRKREFGRLPLDLAVALREAFSTETVPTIAETLPGLACQITVYS